MDVLVVNRSARNVTGSWSSVHLLLVALFAWMAWMPVASAATVAIAVPTATLSADKRTVLLEVAVLSPTDVEAVKRLTFTWSCNLPVSFSSTNTTNRGRTVTAILPRASIAPPYRFSVLVQDPLDNSTAAGTTANVEVPKQPAGIRVTEVVSGNTFSSVFSPVAGSIDTSFAATMLDQFGSSIDAIVKETDGNYLTSTSVDLPAVTWTLSWSASIQEGVVGNPSSVSLSSKGLFSVLNGEGIHSYAIVATLTPDDLVNYSPVSGTAIVQTNQVKIMFRPAQAIGATGYLSDVGAQRLAPTGSTVEWGWNINLGDEAMRNREDKGGSSQDRTQRCFALMQMKTYQRIENAADPTENGSLERDDSGQAIIDQDMTAAAWTLWNLPAGDYTLELMAGDPLYYDRDVDLVLTCGATTARLVGRTTRLNRWISDTVPFTTSGQPVVLTSGQGAVRNLINRIVIKKIITIPN